MIYRKLLALCLALSTGGLRGGLVLPVPDEWANRDAGCNIVDSDSSDNPDFWILWDSGAEETTLMPIPSVVTGSNKPLTNTSIGTGQSNRSTIPHITWV